MKLYLIRHGQSEYNAGLSDRFNSPVTIKGYSQAAKVANYLEKKIDQDFVCYVSPYTRCLQTALAIHYRTGIKCIVTHLLGELPDEAHKNVSNFVYEMTGHFPELYWKDYRAYNYNEPKEKYQQRLVEMVGILNRNEKVITVSHLPVTSHLIKKITGKDELTIPNGSVSLIEDNKLMYCGKEL